MDASSIDAAEKTALSVSKPHSVQSNQSKDSSPIANVRNLENDSVTLSKAGKLSSKQVNSVSNTDSAQVQEELGIGSSGSVKVNPRRELSLTDDRQVILKIIDPETKDVIKQLPAEEQIRLKEAMRNMGKNFLPPKQSE